MIEFEKERDALLPLPNEQIRKSYKIPSKSVKVNTASMITVQSNQYSVPKRFIGKTVTYWIIEDQIYVLYGHRLIAAHMKTDRRLNYHREHYVDILSSHFIGVKGNDILNMAKENLNMLL